MKICAQKDFWAGVMFTILAAVTVLEARSYALGTATKMGPGYFPIALGLLLGGLGLVLIVRSLVIEGEAVERLHMRPLGILAIAIVAFGLMISTLGLVVSLGLVTFFAAAASAQFRPLEAAALSAFVTALSVLIFVLALRLPLSIWPSF